MTGRRGGVGGRRKEEGKKEEEGFSMVRRKYTVHLLRILLIKKISVQLHKRKNIYVSAMSLPGDLYNSSV